MEWIQIIAIVIFSISTAASIVAIHNTIIEQILMIKKGFGRIETSGNFIVLTIAILSYQFT